MTTLFGHSDHDDNLVLLASGSDNISYGTLLYQWGAEVRNTLLCH